PEDEVIKQDPAANRQVKKGSTVTLTVSKGEKMVTVPSVEGKSRSKAEKALQERGLEVGTVSKAASEEKKGTVISSDPSAGESVPEGTKVNLTVSTGAVEVPDVVGQDEGQAKATLTSAGFQVKVIPQ